MPYVSANQVRLHYLASGTGPQDVVLVHGFCQSSIFWKPTLGRLPEDYRGIAVDLKGFGDSDKPEGPYGIPVFADEVLALVDELGLGRIVLVGNSMGGVVCQSFATRYPDRLVGLVLVSTGAFVRNPEAAREKAGQFSSMSWDRDFFQDVVRGFFATPPDNCDELVDVAMKASREAMAQTALSSASLNFLDALRQVGVPTLIVQGERDTSRTPEDGKLIQDAISGSQLHVLAGAGHTPMLERPDLFHPLLLDFLASVSEAAR